MTLREWRTFVTNRVFKSSPLVFFEIASSAKWALYPTLVRYTPRLAIFVHEPESTAVFWAALRSGAIVVDAGANRGGYSILASARIGPEGRVFAFEPEPRNFGKLAENMRPFPNVVPVQKAIGGVDGTAELNIDDFHAGHSLAGVRGTGRTVTVPLTTLDTFVEEQGLPGLDLLKLDVEGVELEALKGMDKILRCRRRPEILCEVHPPILPEQVIHAVDPYGYRCRLLDGRLTGRVHEVPVHVFARAPEHDG